MHFGFTEEQRDFQAAVRDLLVIVDGRDDLDTAPEQPVMQIANRPLVAGDDL